MTDDSRVLYLIVCAAPPCRRIQDLVPHLRRDEWDVNVIATETAATWMAMDEVSASTGHSTFYHQRDPDGPSTLPQADAIAVVPATFNTINKWATGINDSLALGILNEALGTALPILVSPYAKPPLAAHPAFSRHIKLLSDAGVYFTDNEALRPTIPDQPFRWSAVTDKLRAVSSSPGAVP